MLCVLILYIIYTWRTYSLKSTLNDRFFVNLFISILFALRVLVGNLLRENRQRNSFRILFWCLAWGSNPGFSSNKPTHYLWLWLCQKPKMIIPWGTFVLFIHIFSYVVLFPSNNFDFWIEINEQNMNEWNKKAKKKLCRICHKKCVDLLLTEW